MNKDLLFTFTSKPVHQPAYLFIC